MTGAEFFVWAVLGCIACLIAMCAASLKKDR